MRRSGKSSLSRSRPLDYLHFFKEDRSRFNIYLNSWTKKLTVKGKSDEDLNSLTLAANRLCSAYREANEDQERAVAHIDEDAAPMEGTTTRGNGNEENDEATHGDERTEKIDKEGQHHNDMAVDKEDEEREDRAKKSEVELHRLLVENLTRNVNAGHLKEIFGTYGLVHSVELAMDKSVNLPKGFAFVEFEELIDAERAVDFLDRGQIDGNIIRVSFDRPKLPPPPALPPPPPLPLPPRLPSPPRRNSDRDKDRDRGREGQYRDRKRSPPGPPIRRRSPSPLRRTRRSPSPSRRTRRSPSPPRRRLPSPPRRNDGPVGRPRSPITRRGSPPPYRRRSPRRGALPSPPRRRSRSPPRSRGGRAYSPPRGRRSPSSSYTTSTGSGSTSSGSSSGTSSSGTSSSSSGTSSSSRSRSRSRSRGPSGRGLKK